MTSRALLPPLAVTASLMCMNRVRNARNCAECRFRTAHDCADSIGSFLNRTSVLVPLIQSDDPARINSHKLNQAVHAPMIPEAGCIEQAHVGDRGLAIPNIEAEVYFALNFPRAHCAVLTLHPPSQVHRHSFEPVRHTA